MKEYLKLFVVSMVVVLPIIINAQQNSWLFFLDTPLNERIWDMIVEADGSVYFTARINEIDSPEFTKAMIGKLFCDGTLEDSSFFNYPEKSTSISRIYSNNSMGKLLIATIADPVSPPQNGGFVLYTIDEELTPTEQLVYFADSNLLISGSYGEPLYDDNLMISLTTWLGAQTPKSFLFEYDTNFNCIKSKYFSDFSISIPYFKKFENGNYWIINQLLNDYILLDSCFNIIEEQAVPNSLTQMYGVKWDSDTSFYLIGDQIFDVAPHNLAFIKQFHPIDTANHLFNHWRLNDTIDHPAFVNGIDFRNKDSIFIGGTHNMQIPNYAYHPSPSWFVVLQTDSMLNIRWERLYGGDARYFMTKLIATDDGGCLLAGCRYDYQNTFEQDLGMVVLKLNSEGLMVGAGEEPRIEMHEAVVYPNPGSEILNVHIAVQYPNSEILLFDMSGRTVVQQKMQGSNVSINTAMLKPGMYIYQISGPGGLEENGQWLKQ